MSKICKHGGQINRDLRVKYLSKSTTCCVCFIARLNLGCLFARLSEIKERRRGIGTKCPRKAKKTTSQVEV
jgi:hypothetical protein